MDVVGLSWLSLGVVKLDWHPGAMTPLLKKGERRVCSNIKGSYPEPPWEGLCQSAGEESSSVSRTLDLGIGFWISSWL